MNPNDFHHYKKTAVETMTNSELLLVLLDELVKRTIRCGLAIDKQNWEVLEESAQRSIDILNYLDDTLDDQYPVSQNLHKLYDFFVYEYQRVKIGRNKDQLNHIQPMIIDLRDTFRKASETMTR